MPISSLPFLQVGAWRDRIVIYTGKCGPNSNLLKAFLDCGAKAVISSSVEPLESQLMAFHGSGDPTNMENGLFVIGDEEADEDEIEPASPVSVSDWEDSDLEKAEHSSSWRDDDEDDLSQFLSLLYDALFRERATVDIALEHALSCHSKLRYTCHLPSTP